MEKLIVKRPVPVRATAYVLPVGFWNWCRLADVWMAACEIMYARAEGDEFILRNDGIDEFIKNFIRLTRKNSPPGSNEPKRRRFRYVVDELATEVLWIEVGVRCRYRTTPPRSLPRISPKMFVPEGWSCDVLSAVQQGVWWAHLDEMGLPWGGRLGSINDIPLEL